MEGQKYKFELTLFLSSISYPKSSFYNRSLNANTISTFILIPTVDTTLNINTKPTLIPILLIQILILVSPLNTYYPKNNLCKGNIIFESLMEFMTDHLICRVWALSI